MKIRGVDLRRRFNEKAAVYDNLFESCHNTIVGLKAKLEVLSQPPSLLPLPSPVEIMNERAEAFKSRAEDLRWLSGCIVEGEVHDIAIEEMMHLGILGYISESSCGHDHSDD